MRASIVTWVAIDPWLSNLVLQFEVAAQLQGLATAPQIWSKGECAGRGGAGDGGLVAVPYLMVIAGAGGVGYTGLGSEVAQFTIILRCWRGNMDWRFRNLPSAGEMAETVGNATITSSSLGGAQSVYYASTSS